MATFGLGGQLIRKSVGDSIASDLLAGVTGRKVFTDAAVSGGVLTISFADESNTPSTLDVTLGGDSEVYRLEADGSRPDITEAIWQGGALLIEPSGLYTAERHVASTTRPSGTWNQYQTATFYEAYNQYNFPATAPNGSLGYTRHSHQFWTKNPAGIWRVSTPPDGHRYLGVESDEDDANDAAIENGDLAFFDGHLRVVSNFTAAGVTYDYEWENAIRAPDVSANPTGDDGDDLERLRIGGEDFIVRGQGSRFFGSFFATVDNDGIQIDIPGIDDTEDGDIVTFRLPGSVTADATVQARLRINSGALLFVVYSDRDSVGITSMLGSSDVRWRVQRHDGRYFLLDTDAFRHTQTVITQISSNDEFLVGDASGLNFAPAKIRATELARELAERAPLSAFIDAIRYGLVVFENRNPTESDYANHRLFFDGITVRRVRRTPVPGHDRVVVFSEDNLGISQYGTGIYVNRQAADDVPGTPSIGERYYNRNQAHWEIWEAGNYWNTAQFIAAPVDAQGPLWIGERGNEAEAAALADRADEIAAYPDDGGTYVLQPRGVHHCGDGGRIPLRAGADTRGFRSLQRRDRRRRKRRAGHRIGTDACARSQSARTLYRG